ncbi:BQ2448_7226 [Microbotryum intermedium]|uniref:BQ2448_7226 protein n=1 Tax=Microbotryum intermedium TaxID=269621 RepID=A0A238FHK5_9BASI|nr:BQ2448_7226 [Microbotryum intermedium]
MLDTANDPNDDLVFPNPFKLKGVGGRHADVNLVMNPVLLEPSFNAPYTLQELEMKALSYKVRTTEPDWLGKRHDRDVRAAWKRVALKLSNCHAKSGLHLRPLTAEIVDDVLDELEDFVEIFELVGQRWRVNYGCFDAIFESNDLIPYERRSSIIAQVAMLEKAIEAHYSSSPAQVVHLVDPSLYPLVYGQSLVCSRGSDSSRESVSVAPAQIPETLLMFENPNEARYLSEKYQWLPAEFAVDSEGQVKIESCINNVHPKDHALLYGTLARIFSRLVRLFDRTLSDLMAPRARVISSNSRPWFRKKVQSSTKRRGEADHWGEFESEPPEVFDEAVAIAEEEWSYDREIVLPEPDEFEPTTVTKLQDERMYHPAFTLKGRTVQVFVKFVSIELSPDRPEYEGEEWRVEGMENEAIVATGVYYYDEKNVTDWTIAFRGTFDADKVPCDSRNDVPAVEAIFGLIENGPCVQHFNKAPTPKNRCLTFPNIYQHCHSKFSLVDRTRPGHRKMLVFSIVDPLQRIPSTSDVAPQQREWIERALFSPAKGRLPRHTEKTQCLLDELPNELSSRILDLTDELMTRDEATAHWEKLVAERQRLLEKHTRAVYVRRFRF